MIVKSDVNLKERIYWKDGNKKRSAIVNQIRFPMIQDLDTQILIGCIDYFVTNNVKRSSTINWNGGVVRNSDLLNTNTDNQMELKSIYDLKNKVFYMENNFIRVGYVGGIQFPLVRLKEKEIAFVTKTTYFLKPTPKGTTDWKIGKDECDLFSTKKDLLKSL